MPKLARKRMAPISIAIAAALASVLVTIAVVRSCSSDSAPSAEGIGSPPRTAPAPALLSVATEPDPVREVQPTPEPIASGDAPPIATPPGPTRRPTATRTPATPPTKKSKPDCTPPYTLDKDGVRIPKRECFR